MKRCIACLLCLVCLALPLLWSVSPAISQVVASQGNSPIKWVDFDIPYSLLETTMQLDIESYGTETHLDWIELLSYLAAKYGGNFSLYRKADLDRLVERLQQGEYTAHLAKGMKYYNYYYRAYSAVLGGLVGEFEIDDGTQWKRQYGLKAFSPIAEGYWYTDYDDFGAGRTYGYARKHLGHDMMVSTGTPVIAVESGVVEALGWNQYGGWRIGIRSLDGKRYYYYAHLRKDRPYANGLTEGMEVTAGDVIGYSGQTGYSIRENVNNIDTPHLHWGVQLIFDESQKDGPNEIWIDLYSLTRLLSQHRATVRRDEASGEMIRAYPYREVTPDDASAQVASSSQNSEEAFGLGRTAVPILMYHSLLKDGAFQNRFVISPQLLESDLQYLQEHGYTTITMSELIDFVKKRASLPEKPILLTFDDGYYNNYFYAYPLLQTYRMKAVISVVGKYTEEFSLADSNHPNYSHLTWDQLKEMQESGLVEIQNHTYDLHSTDRGRKGAGRAKGETEEHYRQVLTEDVVHLQELLMEHCNILPNTFTYPYGEIGDGAEEIIRDLGFEASLGCTEKINWFSQSSGTEDLYGLGRFLRPNDMSSEAFFTKNNIL